MSAICLIFGYLSIVSYSFFPFTSCQLTPSASHNFFFNNTKLYFNTTKHIHLITHYPYSKEVYKNSGTQSNDAAMHVQYAPYCKPNALQKAQLLNNNTQ